MERRQHKRRRFWLPIEVEGLPGGVAVSHDASDNGLLVVCSAELPVGVEVRVLMTIPPGGPVTVPVVASVVRVSRNDDDPDGIWPFKMALHFRHPVDELEAFLAQLPNPAPSEPP